MMKNIFRYLFSFSGNISRKQYIWPVIMFILTFIVFNYRIRIDDSIFFISAIFLLTLVSFLSFTTRRLRDINRSYIWMLSVLITPVFMFVCLVLCFIPSKKVSTE